MPLFIMVLLGIFMCSVTAARAAVSEKDIQSAMSGNNAFALQIYEQLRNQEGNLVFSPYSISSSVAMAYAGSRGTTKAQMEDVFHLAVTGDEFHKTFRHINDRLLADAKGRRYDLKMMNSLWYADSAEINADYRRVVKNYYGASALPVNMKLNPESARRIINSWFEKQSRGKFKDLIAAGKLSPQTRLVLANAIYFKGAWSSKFDKRNTEKTQFTLLDGKQVVVPMMRQTGKFNYTETDKFQALELPYRGSKLSMVILLPKEPDGLTNVEKSLSKENIEEWLNGMSKQEIDVDLPKFKFRSKLALVEPLKSLGLTEAFSVHSADFSGIDGEKDLFISDVLHAAMVEVSEMGTEAAAASSAAIADGLRSSIAFRAYHPFIFLIRQTDPTAILFLGRLVNPKDQ